MVVKFCFLGIKTAGSFCSYVLNIATQKFLLHAKQVEKMLFDGNVLGKRVLFCPARFYVK